MTDANEYYLRQHESEAVQEDLKQERIEEQYKLLKDDYASFEEAVHNLTEHDLSDLHEVYKTGNVDAVGIYVIGLLSAELMAFAREDVEKEGL